MPRHHDKSEKKSKKERNGKESERKAAKREEKGDKGDKDLSEALRKAKKDRDRNRKGKKEAEAKVAKLEKELEKTKTELSTARAEIRRLMAAAATRPTANAVATGTKSPGASRDHTDEPWFHPNLNANAAYVLLNKKPEGTFLCRPSSVPGCVAVTYVRDGDVRHGKIEASPGAYKFGDEPEEFPSLRALVQEWNHVFVHPCIRARDDADADADAEGDVYREPPKM